MSTFQFSTQVSPDHFAVTISSTDATALATASFFSLFFSNVGGLPRSLTDADVTISAADGSQWMAMVRNNDASGDGINTLCIDLYSAVDDGGLLREALPLTANFVVQRPPYFSELPVSALGDAVQQIPVTQSVSREPQSQTRKGQQLTLNSIECTLARNTGAGGDVVCFDLSNDGKNSSIPRSGSSVPDLMWFISEGTGPVGLQPPPLLQDGMTQLPAEVFQLEYTSYLELSLINQHGASLGKFGFSLLEYPGTYSANVSDLPGNTYNVGLNELKIGPNDGTDVSFTISFTVMDVFE